jgi:hypothetical protein
MKLEFKEKGNWILPKEGNLGNKAKNLLDNTPVIEACQLKVPRSLVIPYEYLQAVDNPTIFTLEQIDRYFPEWLRVVVRSNAPDEDLTRRNPGQYVSEDLWHNDRDNALNLINRVIKAYNIRIQKMLRRCEGLEEKAMCLLIQDLVSNTPGEFDVTSVGSFNDIGDLAVLTFNYPDLGLEAMTGIPLKEYKVDKQGRISEEHSESEQLIAERLRKLADSLPRKDKKGWEIEFVENKEGIYVVQTTPISKKEGFRVKRIENSIFAPIEFIGIGEIYCDGILYVDDFPELEELYRFNNTHRNYCVATDHAWISTVGDNIDNPNTYNLIYHISNAGALLDIGGEMAKEFSVHLKQWMREGRAAMKGIFDSSLIQLPSGHGFYSPTKLIVRADELENQGNVEVVGEIKPFVPLDQYLESLEK